MGKLRKILLIAGGITLGAAGFTFLGEKTQPVSNIKEAIEFHNVGPAPNTPDNYKAWHIVVKKDKNLDAIVKITDDSTTYILDKNLGPVTPEQQQEYLSVVGKTAAEDTPKDFLNADVTYKVNDEGFVEMYFGNKKSGQYWQVNENWTAGDVGQQVDHFFEKIMKELNVKDKKKKFKEDLIEGKSKVDSFYNEGKEKIFPGDSAKTNFWKQLKENTLDAYENIKERFEKK